ncbi:MAG: glycosyltransferase [Saprospiraceae bacterium]|nr:glycosyltransferase [Candidatus Brachybacter algidus]MBL0226744.1 glycosyltransferase [Geobacteraceae bacterium]
MKSLDFLIPSYKRPEMLTEAVDSVAKQVIENHLEDRVAIVVVDDCSPNVDLTYMAEKFSLYSNFLCFSKNRINKGMGLNIRDMVASSQADYCCIMTDDDLLQPGALSKIIHIIDGRNDHYGPDPVGAFYVPRYAYLEDGSLHDIVCESFKENTIIEPGPLNALKYMHDGFVLTGLFFQPRLINYTLWDTYIENAFFPVIYFADLLSRFKCLYVSDNWFIHRVLNECHWESWGATEKSRCIRLYRDYMQAVSIVAQQAFSRTPLGAGMLNLFREEADRYKQQISSVRHRIENNLSVYQTTWRRAPYWVARLEVSEFYQRIRPALGRAGRVLSKSVKTAPPK